jgi:hypothetical protein
MDLSQLALCAFTGSAEMSRLKMLSAGKTAQAAGLGVGLGSGLGAGLGRGDGLGAALGDGLAAGGGVGETAGEGDIGGSGEGEGQTCLVQRPLTWMTPDDA